MQSVRRFLLVASCLSGLSACWLFADKTVEEEEKQDTGQISYSLAPEAIPESLDAKINSSAPAGQQLDALEGWLGRQKDHDAGDWPEAGDFTGGKHDRHASADDFQA